MRNELTERVIEYLNPTRIVLSEKCVGYDSLLTAKDSQIFLYSKKDEFCVLEKGGYIVLDFGKEIHGGLRVLNSKFSSEIRIRFGESVSETCAELKEKGACNDHSVRDMTVELPLFSDSEYGQTGFRFVRIDNVGNENLNLVALYAAYKHLKVLPVGSFECSDERINEIYETAARTLFLCMQNRLWDGIKRDRLVWIGDMHPETTGIYYLYGDHPLVELGISETAEHSPTDEWMNGIPSYSFWWLAILCDYEFRCDKWEFAKSQLPYAEKLLKKINGFVSENGKILYDFLFLNWETYEDKNLECANRGLLLWTVNKYIEMLKRHGDSSHTAELIRDKLRKNEQFDGTSKAVAAIYSLGYGINERVKSVIVNGGTDGFSTFMCYYIADVLKKCAGVEVAFNAIKEFYGGMLDRGATTFWESYEPSWLNGSGRIDELPKNGEKNIHSDFGKYCYNGFRLSLCHGWSCAPVQFFAENALGVKFVEAGGRKIKIEPELGGLLWAKGKIPTAYGLIEVENVKTADGIKTSVRLPDGVSLVK